MPTITGHLEFTYKRDKNIIYQTIRFIPNERKNTHYFVKDKYRLGRKVDDFIAERYLGDRDNIIFDEAQKFRNIRIIKYQLLNPSFEVDLTTKKYFIDGTIPQRDSCEYCEHCRELTGSNKIRCVYYRKIILPKIHCIDFGES